MKLKTEKKFKYHYVDVFLAKLVKRSNVLLQLDIHPGDHCGPYKCAYCYGKGQKQVEGQLVISDYLKLLKDVKDKVDFVELSGIISDPMSYSKFGLLIQGIKDNNLGFGIHTKGHFLTPDLIEIITSRATEGDFITISLDTAESDLFNEIHGIPSGIKMFEKVTNSIKALYKEKIAKKSKLRINLTYLLLKCNSAEEQISDFIKQFINQGDYLRFSFPQFPNQQISDGEKEEVYLSKDEQDKASSIVKKYLEAKIIFLRFEDNSHATKFHKCWSQRFNFIVDKSGNVFPCPQTASDDFAHLIYGNIKNDSFQKIWDSEKRKKVLEMPMDEMHCRICDRKDENINIAFENI